MPKKAEAPKQVVAKPEPKKIEVPQPAPDPNETYQVIKRGDAYVVELTLYGRVWHDEKWFPYKHDAEKRLEELSKHLK